MNGTDMNNELTRPQCNAFIVKKGIRVRIPPLKTGDVMVLRVEAMAW